MTNYIYLTAEEFQNSKSCIDRAENAPKDVEQIQPFCREIQKFIPEATVYYYVQCSSDTYKVYSTVFVGFIRNGVTFILRKVYNDNKYYLDVITSMFKEAEDSILYRVKQDYPEPNRIGVFTKRKLEDWITRGLNIYKELEAENEVIQRMKAEYFALLKNEKIQWKDTVRHTEGTIRRNGFIFSFSIHGRNIREEIKLCVPNGKSDYATFTKLADNRLSLATR